MTLYKEDSSTQVESFRPRQTIIRERLSNTVPLLKRLEIFRIEFADSTEEIGVTSRVIEQQLTDQTTPTDEIEEQTLANDNSLIQRQNTKHVEKVIRSMLSDPSILDEDNFEAFQQLIEVHENAALDVIATLVMSDQLDDEIGWEILQFLGRLSHLSTKKYRYWLLERMLRSSSHWMRDGASLGLALMNDLAASISIRQAIEKEQIGALRRSMEKVLEKLESGE